MKIPGSLALKLCLCGVAAAPLALPTTTPTLSASPGAVIFQYNTSEPVPVPVFVNITASNGTSPAIQATVTPAAGTPSTLFPAPPISGDQMQVIYDTNVLYELVSQPGVYTATITVSASGFTPLQVPVTFNVGDTLTVAPSPTALTFNLPGSTSQTIQLTGNGDASISFSLTAATASGGTWLTATANTSYTPAVVTATANSINLPGGTYQGSITVTPAVGGALVIPVTLQVGPNTLTASPTTFAFTYTQGGTVPAAQVWQLNSPLSNDTYVAGATSTGNWLLVNGATANVSGALPAMLNVTVNPAGLAPGNYQGSVTATDAAGGIQTATVTLAVTGLSSVVNPDSLVFVAQAGGPAPTPQVVYVEGFGAATFTATVTGAWLSVSSTSGPAPAQLTISANPTGLAAGTYSGTIEIDVETHVANIEVTLLVSANPVLTVSPGSFIFSYNGGTPAPLPENLAVSASSGSSQSFSIAPGVPSWLRVGSSESSPSTPTNLAITVAPQTLPTGTYLAQVILTPGGSGGVPVIVPVLVLVGNAPAVVPQVTSLAFSASAGAGPQNQIVQVSASSPTSFAAVATTVTGGDWLSVTPANGTANLVTPLTVTADASSLGGGTYQGTVTLTTSGGVVSQIAVSFTVSGTSAPFNVSPTTLAFAYTQNGPVPAAQSLQITGSQSFTAVAATTSGGNWLAVTPASGTNSATLNVSVTPASLAPGTYDGTITVTPAGGVAQTVSVTLAVYAPSSLISTPSTLSFAYSGSGPVPPAQILSITSGGAATTFTATASSSGWLSVSPTATTTPATLSVSVNPANLGGGTYDGSIILTGQSGTLQLSIGVTLTVTVLPPTIQRVVNGASYLSGSIAPGELVTVFGTSLGPTTGVGAAIDSNGYIEGSLANVSVTFNGYPGPILYASAGQINTIVPYELSGATDATVEVMFGGSRSNSTTIPVVPAAPGIFSADASGQGPGAILDLNYNLVSASNPASIGQTIQIFATGQGQTSPGGVDGLIEPGALPLPALLLPYGVSIGNIPAVTEYFGAAPGLVAGALQIDAIIPVGVLPGAALLVISVNGVASQPGITVAIQ
ncbi:MAG TPA: hypothetical protein VMR62_27650 [Bryobacteraceae bacterium]|nr:hypothetical protein [Bryobacteraceae bacterium]